MNDVFEQPIGQPSKFELKTSEQAHNWIERLMLKMSVARKKCDLLTEVVEQRRALWLFLVRHGRVLGALDACYHSGLITERAYIEFNQKAINSLVPSILTVDGENQ